MSAFSMIIGRASIEVEVEVEVALTGSFAVVVFLFAVVVRRIKMWEKHF